MTDKKLVVVGRCADSVGLVVSKLEREGNEVEHGYLFSSHGPAHRADWIHFIRSDMRDCRGIAVAGLRDGGDDPWFWLELFLATRMQVPIMPWEWWLTP